MQKETIGVSQENVVVLVDSAGVALGVRRAWRGRPSQAGQGEGDTADATVGLSPKELAGCIIRTLALPGIAALRPFPLLAALSQQPQKPSGVLVPPKAAL